MSPKTGFDLVIEAFGANVILQHEYTVGRRGRDVVCAIQVEGPTQVDCGVYQGRKGRKWLFNTRAMSS